MVLSLLVILLLTVVGWVLSKSTALGRQLGMTMVVLLLGLLFTNLSGWTPAPQASGWVSGPLTSLAIAQLLLAVQLERLWPDARKLFIPFVAAVFSTLVAVLAGSWFLAPLLGEQAPVLAGLFTATFSGGSLNFVSVARALQPPEALLLLATAADHVVFAIWFALSLLIGKRPDQPAVELAGASAALGAEDLQQPALLSWSLLWGLGVLLISQLLGQLFPAVPSILLLTTVALVAAQLPGQMSRRGCYGSGLLLIQPFFVVIGLSSPVAGLLAEGIPVLLFAAWIVALQGVVLLLLRRWRRWSLGATLVASQAAIGGPSTALALATSIGRSDLALPSVAIGLFGYLLGTYLGLIAAVAVGGG